MNDVQPRGVRVIGCVFTTLVTLLLWCSSAFGWSATREGTAGRWLIVTAADGEANRFDINSSGDGRSIVVRDGEPGNRFSGPLPADCAASGNGISCRVGTGFVLSLRMYMKNGDDQVDATGTNVDVMVSGGDGADVFTGGSRNDIFFGDGGNDVARLGDGNDDFTGGDGADEAFGGAGYDELAGDSGDDRLTGGDGDDQIQGAQGSDTLAGGAGGDHIFGGSGVDSLAGGDGVDSLDGDSENDVISGDAGDDTLSGGDGDDSLSGGSEFDHLGGDAGNDVLRSDDGGGRLDGGDGDDRLDGGQSSDTLIGGNGNDVLSGFEGADSLQGNAGDDSLSGGQGADEIAGGEGIDRLSYEDSPGPVKVSLNDAQDDGVDGEQDNVHVDVEQVVGSAFPDTLVGAQSVANTFAGGPGDDVISDRGGSSAPVDELRCEAGTDSVDADSGDRVTDDCEQVKLDGQVVRKGTVSKASLSLVSSKVLVEKQRWAILELGCAPNESQVACEGSATLQRSATAQAKKSAAASLLGKATFQISPGATKRVPFSLTRKVLKQLKLSKRGKGVKAWVKLDLKQDAGRIASKTVLVRLFRSTAKRRKAQNRARALMVFERSFPQTVDTVHDAQALAPAPSLPIVSYLSENVARLASTDGKGRLLVTNRPLRAKTADGDLQPVDVRLQEQGDGFTPVNAPFVLKVEKAGGGVFTLGPKAGETVKVTPLPNLPQKMVWQTTPSELTELSKDHSAPSDPVSVGEAKLFPQTAWEIDSLITPKIDGVETFEQIHSADAPDTISYGLTLPQGFHARLDENQILRIVDSAGAVKVMALPPTAVDANGNQVETSYELIDKTRGEDQPSTSSDEQGATIGAALVVHVHHNVQGVAYPVLVDPTWVSSYDYVADPKIGVEGIAEIDSGSAPGGPWYEVSISHDSRLPGFIIKPLGGRVYPPIDGVGAKIIYRAPGTTAKIEKVEWRNVYHTNDKERQALRLALYGSPTPAVFDSVDGPMLNETKNQEDPNGALTAEIWMHVPKCKVGEPACPRFVAKPSMSVARVGAMDLTLTDPDYPEIRVLSGSLYDIRDKWVSGLGSHTVNMMVLDHGSGVYSYQLEAINPNGTSRILDRIPDGDLCNERHDDVGMPPEKAGQGAYICREHSVRKEVELVDLAEGKHTFKASAKDYVRQSSDDGGTSVTWNTYIDRTAPTIAVAGELKEKDNTWVNPLGDTTIELKGEDARSGVASYTLDAFDGQGSNVLHDVSSACLVPGPINQPCPVKHNQKVTVDMGDLPSGLVRFEASSTDFAGNVSVPVEWTVFVDRRSPVGRASGDLTKLEGRRTSEDDPVEVELEGKDTVGGSGIAILALKAVDGQGNEVTLAQEDVCDKDTHDGQTPCPQSVKHTVMVDLGKLPDGPTSFRVVATDFAGNVSKDSESWETFIDQTPPGAPSNIRIKQRSEDSALISWDRPPDLDVGEYEYQVRLNGVEVNTWQLTPHPQAVIPVTSNATISVVLRAIDKAKNQSKVVAKTGKVANSGLLDLESEMLGKKKDPRFHPCKGGKGAKCGHYNGKKAAEYARKYAYPPYNTDYHHFDSVDPHSGDCTNYISQALHAGGMALTGDAHTTTGVSWYGTKNTWTATWIDTNWFHNHFLTEEYGPFTRMRQLRSGEEVRIGDVIQVYPIPEGDDKINYYHTVMVTNFIGKGDGRRRLSYHSDDQRDRPWDKFKDKMDHRFTKGGWSHIVERPIYTKVNIK